ncbi:MAG: Na+/H+ antiporter NhaA [Pyrinomonadaceae bacterium]
MGAVQRRLTKTFRDFIRSEQSSGIFLIVCTIASLLLTNSPYGENYLGFWQSYVGGMSVEHWVNDGLMAIFFLFIGLELERELYSGELSDFRNALLPMVAAVGGLAVPALIHFALNNGTPTQAGIGIPMATDIAFALGVLALLSNRVPASLKVFLTALAVMDDLGAIVVIAVFYTSQLYLIYLVAAVAVFGLLVVLNRYLKIMSVGPYIIGGILMWYLMLKSGVHATIAGVLLAFAIPYSAKADDEESPSHKLEHILHKPAAFVILPIFALANTGIVFGPEWLTSLTTSNSSGIILGLVAGKPIGIMVLSFVAVAIGLCKLPLDLSWKHVFGAGLLGGIGFTMSIFITNLALANDPNAINASKLAILFASLTAGVAGFLWLRVFGGPLETDADINTMDFSEAK